LLDKTYFHYGECFSLTGDDERLRREKIRYAKRYSEIRKREREQENIAFSRTWQFYRRATNQISGCKGDREISTFLSFDRLARHKVRTEDQIAKLDEVKSDLPRNFHWIEILQRFVTLKILLATRDVI